MKSIDNNDVLKQQAYNRIEEMKSIVSADPYRQHYHLMPPVGLLNDPNGLVYFQGKYHVFYQWNPFETNHGTKFWGHYSSTDLVNWTAEPIALAPDSWYDKNGCYSGSAVVKDGQLLLFYTGNVKDSNDMRQTYQCVAVSTDGINFEKKGPVVYLPEGYTAHFRDPKVFEKDGKWYMVLGAQNIDGKGEVVLYSSDNLEEWTFQGPIAGSGLNGLGQFGYMWECPDLFELSDTDILIVSPQGLDAKGYEYANIFQSGYFSGKMDFENARFNHGEFTELDRGFDFYAPQTMLDGQGTRLLFAWMGAADDGEAVQPTVEKGWIHSLTIPRELGWVNGKLIQKPVDELAALRKNELSFKGVELDGRNGERNLFSGHVFELNLVITEWDATEFSIEIGSSRIAFSQDNQLFTFERANFGGDGMESRHCHLARLTSIQLFKDTSSIEIFINGGQEVFTSKVFDNPDNNQVAFFCQGTIEMDMKKWDMKREKVK